MCENTASARIVELLQYYGALPSSPEQNVPPDSVIRAPNASPFTDQFHLNIYCESAVMDIESELSIEISDNELDSIRTLGDLIQIVDSKLN